MRHAGLILVLLLLTACQSQPIRPPKVVEVTVEKIVPVPAALSAPCQQHEPQAQTVEEAVRLANVRKASLDECSQRMKAIRELAP